MTPAHSPRSIARRSRISTSAALSACSSITCARDSSAELTSKYGFSVVAPISVTRPSSTAGSSASCWALLKRWISSRKKIVARPPLRRTSARSITARTSALPAAVALSSSNAASALVATIRASVVLPDPGGPYRTIENGRPSSIARRSALPSPSTCSWPTSSATVRGRIRAGSGAVGSTVLPVPSACCSVVNS